jgi:hypothetical protein
MTGYYEIALRRLTRVDALEASLCCGCQEPFRVGEAGLIRVSVPAQDPTMWFHRSCFENFVNGLELFGRHILADRPELVIN